MLKLRSVTNSNLRVGTCAFAVTQLNIAIKTLT